MTKKGINIENQVSECREWLLKRMAAGVSTRINEERLIRNLTPKELQEYVKKKLDTEERKLLSKALYAHRKRKKVKHKTVRPVLLKETMIHLKERAEEKEYQSLDDLIMDLLEQTA